MPEFLRDVWRELRPHRKAVAPRVWPKHIHACVNCTGTHNVYRRRGYCTRCYYVIKYIEDVQGWDRNNRGTLKHIPKRSERPLVSGRELQTDGYSDEEFEICRQNCIEQLKRRLDQLHRREVIRRHEQPVRALDLKEKFAELLRMVRPKTEYPCNATYLASYFGETERRVIYALLEEIIEKIPWHGIIISKYKS
jgi:hypothetical protein